jgi:hypothetical protein
VVRPVRALDLGSGGGLPGLVLVSAWPTTDWCLLDANQRRTEFLQEAVDELGLAGRVTVRRGRAEDLAHDPSLRGTFDLVVARSFGKPAVTAECAAGFLAVGGSLVVSEPPASSATSSSGAEGDHEPGGLSGGSVGSRGWRSGLEDRGSRPVPGAPATAVCPDQYPVGGHPGAAVVPLIPGPGPDVHVKHRVEAPICLTTTTRT